FLVCLMQVGFLWLETGLIRQKNAVNVAVKNMADFCMSAAVFWAVGFGIMFGASQGGWLGADRFFFSGEGTDAWTQVFFFFQLAFCGTAVTIVSGAVAERMTFRGYMIAAGVCAALIYPVFGHWAWGGLLKGEPVGWLEKAGFIDFAGSTVVHSVGGWVALAAILVIGPRLGRFGRRGGPFKPHNLSLSISGAFILWIGWFGFNGGSVLLFDETVPGILLNTLMAPAAGGLACLVVSRILQGKPEVQDIINGVLAGLVAITATCHIVGITDAFLIGAIGGGVSLLAGRGLVLMRLDDAVSAVPVHLAAGIWGTLAVALFGDVEAFGPGVTRLDQLSIQALGVVTAGAFAFGVAFLILWPAHALGLLRVRPRQEVAGLNISEHGAISPLQQLLREMERHARHGDFSRAVRTERDGEAAALAHGYNRVLSRVRMEERKNSRMLKDLQDAQIEAEAANIAKSQFLSNVSHELRTPLNAILGFSQILSMKPQDAPVTADEKEYLRHVEEAGKNLLTLVDQILNFTTLEAHKYDLEEEACDLGALVEEACSHYAGRFEDAGLAVDIHIPADRPMVMADRRAVSQICLQLLSNVIRHAASGGRVSARVFCASDQCVRIEIADQGKGIAPSHLATIFTPFSQAVEPGVLHKPDGLGLGLPTALALAMLHDADLYVQSEPEKGTIATLCFPKERTLMADASLAASIRATS
ncbi:MAG: ammonium transporter, partial [Pseudomonadota bacterium]